MADVLVAEGLSRSFRAGDEVVAAVRDASLRVGERELVAILGRSGAGKSSFLFLCGGLDRPTAGRVTVAGQDVGALAGAALDRFLQRTVGWVFQSPGLLPLLTAEENVALARCCSTARPAPPVPPWRPSAWASGRATGARSCPAASSSAWRSRGRSSRSRRC
jgi:ABC-type lipoprotein export system ATPase subunit